MVDIYRQRRGKFYKCSYWKRDPKGVMDNEELIHKTSPAGIFYANISSSKYQDMQDLAGVFRVGSERITIETEDFVNVDADDLVSFKGSMWKVVRSNTDPVQKNSEFSSRESNKTYIELIKGM